LFWSCRYVRIEYEKPLDRFWSAVTEHQWTWTLRLQPVSGPDHVPFRPDFDAAALPDARNLGVTMLVAELHAPRTPSLLVGRSLSQGTNGFQIDSINAYKWLSIAVRLGAEGAPSERKRVGARLSPEKRKLVDRRVDDGSF